MNHEIVDMTEERLHPHPISHPKGETATELTVTIKDDEKTVRNKFLLYETYSLTEDDMIIKDCIAKTLLDFNGEPNSIRLRVSLNVL